MIYMEEENHSIAWNTERLEALVKTTKALKAKREHTKTSPDAIELMKKVNIGKKGNRDAAYQNKLRKREAKKRGR